MSYLFGMKYVSILSKFHAHADTTLHQDNEKAPKAIQEAIDGSSYKIQLGALLDQLFFMKRQYEGKTRQTTRRESFRK